MMYRCTFPQRYPLGSPGHTNKNARQGHYALAESPSEAADVVRRRVAKRDGGNDSLDLAVDVEVWEDYFGAPQR